MSWDYERSVELGWEQRERFDALDDRWVREGEADPEPECDAEGDGDE